MLKTPSCPVVIDAEVATDRSEASSKTANSHDTIIPSVVALLKPTSPTAVARFVSSIVVNTFNGQTARTFSHILQEVHKGTPAITDSESSSAVIMKGRVVRISTTIKHCSPLPISKAVRHTVLDCSCISTSTTFATRSLYQGDVENRSDYATSAFDYARASCSSTRQTMDRAVAENFPVAKGASDNRDFSRHNGLIVVFSGGRSATTGAHCDIALAA